MQLSTQATKQQMQSMHQLIIQTLYPLQPNTESTVGAFIAFVAKLGCGVGCIGWGVALGAKLLH